MKQVFRGFSLCGLGLLLILGFSIFTMAQDTSPEIIESEEISNLIYFGLDSEATGKTYGIGVGLPASYGYREGHKYPVVYMTDADTKLPGILELARALAANGSIPEVILVGIYNAGENTRKEDFSPALTKMSLEDFVSIAPVDADEAFGGADKFYDFVSTTLIPLIDNEFETDTSTRVYFGHSMGGLFGLQTIQQDDDPFTHYLLSSPSVWFDDRAILEREMSAKERTIYLSVGEFEQIPTNLPEDILAYFPPEIVAEDAFTRMVEGMLELYDYFSMQEGLEVYAHIEESGNHLTADTPGFIRGMQVLLPGTNQGVLRERSAMRPALPWE